MMVKHSVTSKQRRRCFHRISADGSPRVVIYGGSQGVARSTRKDTQRGLDGLLPVWSLQQTIDHLTDTENQKEMCGNQLLSEELYK